MDECKTLYFAGQDSTASLLAWTILLLALHTDWQDEARKEVLQVFGKQNQPNHDGIAKLKTVRILNSSASISVNLFFLTNDLGCFRAVEYDHQ